MKLIKHLINIMFLWSIPFIMLAFFMLVTWFSFSYREVITSGVWVAVMFFYCLMTVIMYAVGNEEEDALCIVKP